ncbi:hypothetical protein AB4Y45_35730 [Paraburkholderia sp. EG287A]|uniref:hypothetical protein n=1 Tax=Paraburkholderia sp. EG287A TaxID=3237012 RepID=UPI0034D18505
MQKARDDFHPKVKQLLGERVNYHCSLCDAPTLGPKNGTTDKRFSIGKAAHVKAAAKGGPRYDENQSPEERSAIENGLWACANCADLIDRDVATYPVEELLRIKADAEWLATVRAGKPPGSELTALLNPTAIKRAVDVFCSRESLRQERIDPRFKVAVRMGESGPVYEVTAKETVEGQLVITGQHKEGDVQALRDFFSYGGSHEIDGADLRMEGSPLFETGDVAAVRWKLSSTPKPVTLTAVLDEESSSPLFIEFNGSGTQGNKGGRLKGTAFGGMLSATLTADYVGPYTDFKFDFDIQPWAGKPVRRLPNFLRLRQVLQLLAAPTRARLLCAHEGLESELGNGIVDGSEKFRPLRALFDEIEILRKLDDFFDLQLALPEDLSEVLWRQSDMSQLLELIDIEASMETEVLMMAVPEEATMPTLGAILANSVPEPITANHTFTLELLGHTYGPYPVAVSCPAATVHVVGPANIEVGVPLQLAMRAADGNRWTARLVAPTTAGAALS